MKTFSIYIFIGGKIMQLDDATLGFFFDLIFEELSEKNKEFKGTKNMTVEEFEKMEEDMKKNNYSEEVLQKYGFHEI